MERITKEQMILDLTKEIKNLKQKTELVDLLNTVMVDINPEPDDEISIIIRKLSNFRIKQAKESIVFFESLIEELNATPKDVA